MGSYYEGKVAIVTGAASGIGAGLTRALAQHGAAVVVSSHFGSIVRKERKEREAAQPAAGG